MKKLIAITCDNIGLTKGIAYADVDWDSVEDFVDNLEIRMKAMNVSGVTQVRAVVNNN